ncbi:MAG: hypothetical protein QME88_10245 [Actinomycetota bacterium]|nr:hypothetical protein [Actinomycetota bacterium]
MLEAYKAACLVVDWTKAVTTGLDDGRQGLDEEMDKWAFLEQISRPEVKDYGQIADPVRLLSITASLELALLLSADKSENFAIRREWQKLVRWLRERHDLDVGPYALASISMAWPEDEMPVGRALKFIFEHMPELRSGWNEGGANALNDYLYLLWLRAKER